MRFGAVARRGEHMFTAPAGRRGKVPRLQQGRQLQAEEGGQSAADGRGQSDVRNAGVPLMCQYQYLP